MPTPTPARIRPARARSVAVPPPGHAYLTIDLRLSLAGPGQLRVEVQASPAGETTDDAVLPISPALDDPDLTSDAFLVMADALGAALLPARVAARFAASREIARSQGAGLRMRVRTEDRQLAALPWEAARVDGEFLALAPSTSVVRYPQAPTPPEALQVEGPLHLLGLVATPKDLPFLDAAGSSDLNRLSVPKSCGVPR